LVHAAQAHHNLQGRWLASNNGVEYKIHFFEGQQVSEGAWTGYFSERVSTGYRGAGKYEVQMTGRHRGTITLYDHSFGTAAGNVDLGHCRLEVGSIVYSHQ
jgi:hypothetical protein